MDRFRVPILAAALVVMCLGVMQLTARPVAAGNCPTNTGCGCGTAYDPVVCKGGCRYTNMCHARCAGFTSKDCKSLRP
jgi:hypothetical protein